VKEISTMVPARMRILFSMHIGREGLGGEVRGERLES
jgi:hypothetical protein